MLDRNADRHPLCRQFVLGISELQQVCRQAVMSLAQLLLVLRGDRRTVACVLHDRRVLKLDQRR
jgi:hypothetical protein